LQVVLADDILTGQFALVIGGQLGRRYGCLGYVHGGFGHFDGLLELYRVDDEQRLAFFNGRAFVYAQFGDESADVRADFDILASADSGCRVGIVQFDRSRLERYGGVFRYAAHHSGLLFRAARKESRAQCG
jgi:hypothetical protein